MRFLIPVVERIGIQSVSAAEVPILSVTPDGLASGRDAGMEAALARLGAE